MLLSVCFAVLIYFVSYNCYYVKLPTYPTLFAYASANALRTLIILLNRRKTSIILLLVENPTLRQPLFQLIIKRLLVDEKRFTT